MTAFILKRKITDLRKSAKKANEVSHQFLDEALHGYVDSKIYQSHNYFTYRYSGKQSILNNYLAGIQSVQMLPARIMETFAIGAFFVLLLSTWNGNSISLSVTTAAAFMAAAYKVIPALSKIINSVTHIHAYKFTVGLLNEHVTNDLVSDNHKLNIGIKSVEFKNVSFGFNSSSFIKDFNLKIQKGDFIGFSGLSGRGKTTIINLLLGFHEVREGSILLNDQETTANERAISYKHISYVKQTPFLINESLLKNITLNETADESCINDILEVTGLSKLINGFKLADKTIIKQEGKNISGGQKQRIAFARGLHKNFDLLILDEPFSELDADSERKMIRYLKSLSDKGKMVLLISHNKESFQYCNKTISFDEQ
jgi:ABC-type bacteriocin/lantibiotic exporter with double-glycine peptidase domain